MNSRARLLLWCNLPIFGLGGIAAPFLGIKLIGLVLQFIGVA